MGLRYGRVTEWMVKNRAEKTLQLGGHSLSPRKT